MIRPVIPSKVISYWAFKIVRPESTCPFMMQTFPSRSQTHSLFRSILKPQVEAPAVCQKFISGNHTGHNTFPHLASKIDEHTRNSYSKIEKIMGRNRPPCIARTPSAMWMPEISFGEGSLQIYTYRWWVFEAWVPTKITGVPSLEKSSASSTLKIARPVANPCVTCVPQPKMIAFVPRILDQRSWYRFLTRFWRHHGF